MRIKLLTSIMRIVGVLMIVSIIPSCAFASENNSPNQISDMRFGPTGNVTAENFASVQTSLLDSISKQITELQSFYTNVSEASNATELKEVLASHRLPNECMGPDGMHMEPGHMTGFNLEAVANVTDDNFTDVQTEIVDSLGNMTDVLKDQLNDTKVSQDSNRTEEVNARITEIQNLSTKVSGASTAAELKEVVFTYMQTQAVDSIEKEIEHLQTQANESENTGGNTTGLNSRITELTTLKEKISGAGSLEDLKTILTSSQEIPGMRDDMMHHRGHDRSGCRLDKPGRMSSIDNTTENT
jgi:hypothetical protein